MSLSSFAVHVAPDGDVNDDNDDDVDAFSFPLSPLSSSTSSFLLSSPLSFSMCIYAILQCTIGGFPKWQTQRIDC